MMTIASDGLKTTITIGQMQHLNDRLNNIMGAPTPRKIKLKRLHHLYHDINKRFDTKKDKHANQFKLDVLNYCLEA